MLAYHQRTLLVTQSSCSLMLVLLCRSPELIKEPPNHFIISSLSLFFYLSLPFPHPERHRLIAATMGLLLLLLSFLQRMEKIGGAGRGFLKVMETIKKCIFCIRLWVPEKRWEREKGENSNRATTETIAKLLTAAPDCWRANCKVQPVLVHRNKKDEGNVKNLLLTKGMWTPYPKGWLTNHFV